MARPRTEAPDELGKLTAKRLKKMCEDHGIASYGTKGVMIERLEKHFAEKVTEKVFEEKGEERPVADDGKQLLIHPDEVANYIASSPVISEESLWIDEVQSKVEQILAESRYPGVTFDIDTNEGTINFWGGPKQSGCTTLRQPMATILKCAKEYIQRVDRGYDIGMEELAEAKRRRQYR